MESTQLRKTQLFILFGGLFGFLSVLAGAFGAHALRGSVSAEDLATFQTAVQYQMYHSLLLVLCGALVSQSKELQFLKWLTWSGKCAVLGIFVFSGSLYLLVLTNARWWGAVTPLGGGSFLAAWFCLAKAGKYLLLR